jgi:hypothetical protein
MTTIESKKVIMKFMGVEPQFIYGRYQWNDAPFFFVSEFAHKDAVEGIAKYVKYDTSWDWLMAVVEKLCYNFDGQQFYQAEEKLNDALLSVKIEKVYEACVNWILEINKDKQNELNI